LTKQLTTMMYNKWEYNRNYRREQRRIRKNELRVRLLQVIAELRSRILLEVVAYIAGVIDGEGCITFQIDHRRRLLHGREINTVTFRPYVSIGTTNEACLRFIHGAIGFGSVRFKKHEPPLRNSWEYVVTGHRNISILLALVNPYLIVKRKQGELTYEFCMSRMFEEHLRFGVIDKSGYSKREREIVSQVKNFQIKSQRK